MKLFTTAVLTLVLASSSFASIVLVGPAEDAGAGLGNRLTTLTVQSPANSTLEEGCVNATGGTSGCGFPDAEALEGNAQIQAYTIADLGFSSFVNLGIVFNAAQPGNSDDLTLNALVLTLYNPNGDTAQFSLAAPVILDSSFLGIGQEGFLFVLDPTQAAQADAFASGSTTVLGLGASISGAVGGPDTFSYATFTGPGGENPIPEPSSYALLASGALALIGARKFRKA
jgi:hypothetical protein